MPIHRVPRARLHEDITAIEREGERVTAIAVDGDHVIVATCWLGERLERRHGAERDALSVERTVAERRYAGGGIETDLVPLWEGGPLT
jgi:hypothetical protein